MTHAQAHNILDLRRAGADMPEAVVNQALDLTGDRELDPVQSAINEMRSA